MSNEDQGAEMAQEPADPVIGIDDTPPTLNRAERRAQAKGKKSGSHQSGGVAGRFGSGGQAGHARGAAVKTNLPRTGHK